MSNSTFSNSTFINACKTGDIDELNRMIKADDSLVNAQADDQIPAIIHATCANQRGVVDFLLSHGANIEAKDADFHATALGFSAWFGHADMARFLVEGGCGWHGRKSIAPRSCS